ncbi:predicted protein, partial [Streptomyces sp. C]
MEDRPILRWPQPIGRPVPCPFHRHAHGPTTHDHGRMPMKLLRVGPAGSERPALLDQDGTLRDLSGLITDVDGALLSDESVLSRVREAAEGGELPVLDAEGLRIGSAVGRIGKVVGIGLNYFGHAAEVGAEPPAEPILFLKAADTVVGPDDTVLIPRGSVK